MARRPRPPRPGLPDRAALRAFLDDSPGKVGIREIARHFGVPPGRRHELRRLIGEAGGVGDEAVRHRPGELPEVGVFAVFGRDAEGFLAAPAEWNVAAHGPAPQVRLEPGRDAPAVGDVVLARVEAAKREGELPSATLMRVLTARATRVFGVFRSGEAGGFIEPVEKRSAGRNWRVRRGDEGSAHDGDLVALEALRGGRFEASFARVREVVGSTLSEKAVSLIAILTHGIPLDFGRAALAEAENARPAPAAGREDWRDLPLVTIDPADAKDHDDAVHAAADADPANPGGFVVTVAIADVAAYVRPGSALDREALDRGNSVYFPDRVVPMLPERLSNGLCSLVPGEERAALAVRLVIGADGEKRRHSFHRIRMRSSAKLSYPQAQAAIDGVPDDDTAPLLDSVLRPLWAAYRALARARDHREPLALDLPERKILLTPDGTIDRVVVPPRLDAHRLIEAMMISANVAAAETLEKARVPLVYRVHDAPSPEKLNALREFLQTLDIPLAKHGALRPAEFNRILAAARGAPNETLVNEVVLRSQAQAEYAVENYGHFGLNLRRYAHFTSPIRRYADLLVHRALVRAQNWGEDGLTDREIATLPESAARISAAERRALAAERETADRLIAAFLQSEVGATFQGRIGGVTRAGLFVSLADTGADGFVPISTLGNEYFRHEEAQRALVGGRTGTTYRLGDTVEVRLVEVQPVAGALRFEVLPSAGEGAPGRSGPSRESGKGRRTGYIRGRRRS